MPKKCNLKAVAITGRESDEEREQGLAAGYDYYLTKPVGFPELRQALENK